jgi:hypothetical protein
MEQGGYGSGPSGIVGAEIHRADIADCKRVARQTVEQVSKSIFPMASVADTIRPEAAARLGSSVRHSLR